MARTVADQFAETLAAAGAEAHLTSITLEMAKGFTLYMVKAMINGRGDDLALSNLWR